MSVASAETKSLERVARAVARGADWSKAIETLMALADSEVLTELQKHNASATGTAKEARNRLFRLHLRLEGYAAPSVPEVDGDVAFGAVSRDGNKITSAQGNKGDDSDANVSVGESAKEQNDNRTPSAQKTEYEMLAGQIA